MLNSLGNTFVIQVGTAIRCFGFHFNRLNKHIFKIMIAGNMKNSSRGFEYDIFQISRFN